MQLWKMANDGSAKSKDTLKWIEQMDNILVNALLEEQYKGNKVDSVFTIHYLQKCCQWMHWKVWFSDRKTSYTKSIKDT